MKMGYNREIHKEVNAQLNKRQIISEASAEKRRQDFFSKYPRARQIECEISKAGILSGKVWYMATWLK